jgi:hypothetical protein
MSAGGPRALPSHPLSIAMERGQGVRFPNPLRCGGAGADVGRRASRASVSPPLHRNGEGAGGEAPQKVSGKEHCPPDSLAPASAHSFPSSRVESPDTESPPPQPVVRPHSLTLFEQRAGARHTLHYSPPGTAAVQAEALACTASLRAGTSGGSGALRPSFAPRQKLSGSESGTSPEVLRKPCRWRCAWSPSPRHNSEGGDIPPPTQSMPSAFAHPFHLPGKDGDLAFHTPWLLARGHPATIEAHLQPVWWTLFGHLGTLLSLGANLLQAHGLLQHLLRQIIQSGSDPVPLHLGPSL